MSTTNIFETATRINLLFESPQGLIAVSDLWKLPLNSQNPNRANLDDIAIALNEKLQKSGSTASFTKKVVNVNDTTQLAFDVVKHIIDVRMAEDAVRADEAAKKARDQKILALIADKRDAELQGKSIEELEALLNK